MNCYGLNGRHRFIGVFDTGAGGLNVLTLCRRLLPSENYLYFADNANAPYGGYGEDKISELTLAAARKMERYGIKALLLACNTATSAAAECLRKSLPFPVIGMEPAVKPAAEAAGKKDILLLCTPATAKQDKLKKLLGDFKKNNVIIAPQEGLAREIENNVENPAALKVTLETVLTPHIKRKLGAVVLGCTHYIFIKDFMAEILGKGVPIFDGAEGTVKNLKNKLESYDLLNAHKEKGQLLIVTTAPPAYSYWKVLSGL